VYATDIYVQWSKRRLVHLNERDANMRDGILVSFIMVAWFTVIELP